MSTWDQVQSVLARHNLKHERGDMWRCNSPLRPGSDSMAFTLNISDGEHGVWFDHASANEDKGTLYDLAKLLNIDLPHVGTAEESKRAYTGLAEYAKLKGVPTTAFTDMHWKAELVTVKGRPAIEYPTRGGLRWRFVDGNKPYFISEPGYRRCWYGLQRAVEIAKALNKPLIFTNGEPSVVVGQYFGLPVTTITSGEKGTYPPELISQLKDIYSGEITVALDCDYKGSASALNLKHQLEAAGFKVKAVDLALDARGDIADFCKLHGKDAITAIDGLHELVAIKEAQLALPTAPTAKVDYVSDLDALKTYIDEVNGDSAPGVPPLINPYTFLHKHGGLGKIIPAGKLLYFASVSGGTKTIGFETGWEAYQDMGINSIVYSPEWIDDRGAVEMAARSVQRAGGVTVNDMMLNALYQQEQFFKMKTQSGKALDSKVISESISKAVQLMKRPGRVFYIKSPGLSVEKMCAQIEAICEIEAANGTLIQSVWIDFAQLLWLEKPESSGRLWIEAAIGLIKDTCRRKNLVGFISSQMRKDDAEIAKTGGKLSADMMQWLSDQQANFILAFVPQVDINGQRVMWVDPKNPQHRIGKLRGRIVKNSLAELRDEEFEIPVDFLRLSWMQEKAS